MSEENALQKHCLTGHKLDNWSSAGQLVTILSVHSYRRVAISFRMLDEEEERSDQGGVLNDSRL